MKALFLFRLRLCIYLSIAFLTTSMACSCVWDVPDHFCRSVKESNHIVLGVVVETPHWYSMDVKVIEDIHLQTDADTISILGQDGFNCGEWLEDFAVGDTLVLALYEGQFSDVVDNNSFRWHIGFCGLFYLRYINGNVEGEIDFGEESQDYEDFKSGILDCVELSSSTKNYLNKDDLFLLPNPANDHLDIFIENSNGVEYSFDIIGVSGKLVYPNIIVQGSEKRVDLTFMDSGIYFLRTRSTLKFVTKKFIKI